MSDLTIEDSFEAKLWRKVVCTFLATTSSADVEWRMRLSVHAADLAVEKYRARRAPRETKRGKK